MDMWKEIQNRIERAKNSINIAIFGKISSVIKADNTVYVKSSESDEIRDIRIVSPYGLSSLPTNGLYGQVIFNNSLKKASLIGVENAPPIVLDIGEVILYNTIGGNYIHLKNDGKIYMKGVVVNVP